MINTTKQTNRTDMLIGQCPTMETMEKTDNDPVGFYGIQCLAYIMQIRRTHGEEPIGSTLCRIKDSIRDYIVVFRYDPTKSDQSKYGDRLKSLPENWDKLATEMIDHWRGKYGGIKDD